MVELTDISCPRCGSPMHFSTDFQQDPGRYVCMNCLNEISVEDIKKLNIELEEQKAKADHGKAKLTLVPTRIIWDIAAIREYGNNKYPDGGPDNWKKVDAQRYRDAAYRHFLRYIDDTHGCDSESGFPHLWHLACNIAFLCELEDEPQTERSEL